MLSHKTDPNLQMPLPWLCYWDTSGVYRTSELLHIENSQVFKSLVASAFCHDAVGHSLSRMGAENK